MVSFVCNYCQETLKKPKLDQHTMRCPRYEFTCIDCNTDFKGKEYKNHTSCISEAQKYQKTVYNKPVAQKQAPKKEEKVAEKKDEKIVEKNEEKVVKANQNEKVLKVLNKVLKKEKKISLQELMTKTEKKLKKKSVSFDMKQIKVIANGSNFQFTLDP